MKTQQEFLAMELGVPHAGNSMMFVPTGDNNLNKLFQDEA
jgi:hypothetical protein